MFRVLNENLYGLDISSLVRDSLSKIVSLAEDNFNSRYSNELDLELDWDGNLEGTTAYVDIYTYNIDPMKLDSATLKEVQSKMLGYVRNLCGDAVSVDGDISYYPTPAIELNFKIDAEQVKHTLVRY